MSQHDLDPPDYYEYEPNYRPIKPPKTLNTLFNRPLVFLGGVATGLAIAFFVFPAHAGEVCRPKQPDCMPPPIQAPLECGKWFKPFVVSDHYYEHCVAKLPRLFETNATDDAKRYMLCKCIFQGSIWDRRDP
jgi:hypothetical protein